MPINKYSHKSIRKLRKLRKKNIDKLDGVSKQLYEASLGDLKGAGHLIPNGTVNEQTVSTDKLTSASNKESTRTVHSITIETHSEHGEVPVFKGYLQSGNSKDKRYKVKGWLNEYGIIRLEVTQ